jgi:L-asparaginase / beta-aspartyl-peptidase
VKGLIAVVVVVAALAAASCARKKDMPPTPPSAATTVSLPPTPWQAAAIAHGGVGSDPAHVDGCRAAVDTALRVLAGGGDPLAAAVAGVVVLEDDPRFNAGTGSIVRLDGSIQMDAAVMNSAGRFGAVAGLERVKNPVKVAEAVLDTPHLLLMGDGANRFARSLGFGDHDPSTPERRASTEKVKGRLGRAAADLPPFWRSGAWRARWNYGRTPRELGIADGPDGGVVGGGGGPAGDGGGGGYDTVGLAVRAPDGRFGVALSTGGTAVMLRGRVGDVPIFGAGLYAGEHGAAAATGVGERIIEKLLAHTVHGWLAAGVPAQQAAERAVALIDPRQATGIIVLSATEAGAAAARPMAWAARVADAAVWQGPAPSDR